MKEIMQTYGAMIVAVVVGIALLSGFGALKNKMGVAFAPQDILSSDSANDSYDSIKNIPVPGIELKEKMRQNAVSYSVYDLLDVTAHEDNLDKLDFTKGYKEGTPGFYRFTFEVEEAGDTFLDFAGWGKGCAFLNGFNLGRFWEIGPQKRLYIPAPLLKKGVNEIILFETDGRAADEISLKAEPDVG